MIKQIAVIGAGTMGHGVAHTFARHGYKVNLYDSFSASLESAPKKMKNELQFMVDEDYITCEEMERALNNIKLSGDLAESVQTADYVIEAIPERIDLKKELFASLDAYCPAHTVFASNTSSLKLGNIVADLPEERKKHCMISHWYNPAYLIPIVELSKFGNMDEDVFQDVYNLYVNSGKKPVCVCKDIPGMIANRLLHALAREAFHLVEIGAGSPEDIDNAMKFGPCFRSATTGILEVVDLGGVDIWLAGEDNILPALDNSDKACDMLRNLAKEGRMGVKNGKGFFEYPGDRAAEVQDAFFKRLVIQLKASAHY